MSRWSPVSCARLAQRSLTLSEINELRAIVKNLASMVRSDRKIIKATQAFTTTLADNLDSFEEGIYKDLREIRGVAAARASETDRIFQAIGRAALDDDR